MKIKHILIALTIIFSLGSCAAIAKTAAKYWTRKQIKEFVTNCEEKSSRLIGEEKAKQYCDCAVDVVAEKYKDYDDVKKASIIEVLKIAKECKN